MRFAFTFTIAVLAAVVLSAPAYAGPCWEDVVEDWYDNSRVDKTYPINCYREALKNLPEDMRAYSSAPEDIARAMRQAIARQQSQGTTTASNDGGQTGGAAGSSGGGGTSKPEAAIGTTEPLAEVPPPASDSAGSLFSEAFEEIGPSGASSFPLPLAVLGGVALLLMAAGGMGLIARRLRSQRSPFPPR